LLLAAGALGQWFQPPPAPELTPAGQALIFDFETGGEADYDRWPHPEYPGGPSGVTWGIGYDAHQNRRGIILEDWAALAAPDLLRLAATQPFYGTAARAKARAVRDVTVPWALSTTVFLNVDLSRTREQCERAFPGFDVLAPACQDAIESLVFNRGSSMIGPSRREMRAIRDDVPQRDYAGIAAQLRTMERVWRGMDIYAGMRRRREAEAELVESCL
jgi:hypothetical protein